MEQNQTREKQADAVQEASQPVVVQESYLRWFLRMMWHQVIKPLTTGIVMGVGSKLGATLVRYVFLSRWINYREFMTPDQLAADKLSRAFLHK